MGFWGRRTRIWTLICSTLLQNVPNSCIRAISNHFYYCNIFLWFSLNNLAISRFFVYESFILVLIRDKKVSASFLWAFLEKHEKVIDNHHFLEKNRYFPSQIMHQNMGFWGRRTRVWTSQCSILLQIVAN